MTHTVKNSSGEVLTFKSTSDASNELRPSVIVDLLPAAVFGAVGDSTVAPAAQGTLMAMTRTLTGIVSTGISLASSSNHVGSVDLKARGVGGLSVYRHVSAAGQNRTQVKTTSGTVYGWNISNASAALYVQLYDAVSATASGASALTPKQTLRLPASGNLDYYNGHGLAFSSGIAFAIGSNTSSTGAAGASDVILNLYYA